MPGPLAGGSSFDPASPGAIGGTTPAVGTFTVLNLSPFGGALVDQESGQVARIFGGDHVRIQGNNNVSSGLVAEFSAAGVIVAKVTQANGFELANTSSLGTTPVNAAKLGAVSGLMKVLNADGELYNAGDGSGLRSYIVATLPVSPTTGMRVFVSDALAPAFHAAVVGGGSVVTPLFWDSTNWIVY